MKIAIIASDDKKALEAKTILESKYKTTHVDESDVVVALGGDGFMLNVLHRFAGSNQYIYGMNRGTIGFLMNVYQEDGLLERLAMGCRFDLSPLRMKVTDIYGTLHEAIAFNEVSVFRQTRQAAKLSIAIDRVERMQELVCDGIIVATPAGSTAYNLSARGPVLPFEANLLAMTPLNPFRPRRWPGALLPRHVKITFKNLDEGKRPFSVVADHFEVRDASFVEIYEDHNIKAHVLFDAEHSLEERIFHEQFHSF